MGLNVFFLKFLNLKLVNSTKHEISIAPLSSVTSILVIYLVHCTIIFPFSCFSFSPHPHHQSCHASCRALAGVSGSPVTV